MDEEAVAKKLGQIDWESVRKNFADAMDGLNRAIRKVNESATNEIRICNLKECVEDDMIVTKYEQFNGKNYVDANTYDEVLFGLTRANERIAELEDTINYKLGSWDKHGISYQEILGMKDENEILKKRIKTLEWKKSILRTRCTESARDLFDNECYRALTITNSRQNNIKFPFDPLDCANYLINATYDRETSCLERSFAKAPDKVDADKYSIDDLEQIAEHLLVYVKHNREEE